MKTDNTEYQIVSRKVYSIAILGVKTQICILKAGVAWPENFLAGSWHDSDEAAKIWALEWIERFETMHRTRLDWLGL